MKVSCLLFLFLLLTWVSTQAQSASLISFNARWDSLRGNVITWATSQETNNAYFEVQRSVYDLTTFTTIGQVNSKGNSTVRQDYEYIDKEGTLTDLVYFRLKQTDLVGNIRFYAAIVVRQGPFGSPSLNIMNVYPGPGTDYLQVRLTNRHIPSSARIFDIRGTQLGSPAIVRNDLIDVRFLPGGFYVLEVTSTTGQPARKRFFK
ncbi:T9SS type A sorting domain-containing protein [Spirosoma jeollabukense]